MLKHLNKKIQYNIYKNNKFGLNLERTILLYFEKKNRD